MSSFSLKNFQAEVLGKGLARPNRFEVDINVPPGMPGGYKNFGRTVSLLCEESNFPPLIITTKAYRIFGPAYQRPVSAEFGGEGISMTFHVDRTMKVKRFFEEWSHIIVEKNTYLLGYQNEYIVNILIKQLDEQDNITYKCNLYEAFPRSINIMQLNQAVQNQTHRLTVMFAYRYWEAVDEKERREKEEIKTNIESLSIPQFRRQFGGLNPGLELDQESGSDLPISA